VIEKQIDICKDQWKIEITTDSYLALEDELQRGRYDKKNLSIADQVNNTIIKNVNESGGYFYKFILENINL
jgi:hypothetical protein